MESSNKPRRRRNELTEEDRHHNTTDHGRQEAENSHERTTHEDRGQETNHEEAEDRQQEPGDNEGVEDEHQDADQGVDNILDYAIEYRMRGTYPPGLSKDKKRAVRKRAQVIVVEEGEVYIQRKKNKVCYYIIDTCCLG